MYSSKQSTQHVQYSSKLILVVWKISDVNKYPETNSLFTAVARTLIPCFRPTIQQPAQLESSTLRLLHGDLNRLKLINRRLKFRGRIRVYAGPADEQLLCSRLCIPSVWTKRYPACSRLHLVDLKLVADCIPNRISICASLL